MACADVVLVCGACVHVLRDSVRDALDGLDGGATPGSVHVVKGDKGAVHRHRRPSRTIEEGEDEACASDA